MVNEALVEYLKEGEKRGFDIDFLKEKLIEGGFSEHSVLEAAIVYDQRKKGIVPKKEPERPTHPSPPEYFELSGVKNPQASERKIIESSTPARPMQTPVQPRASLAPQPLQQVSPQKKPELTRPAPLSSQSPVPKSSPIQPAIIGPGQNIQIKEPARVIKVLPPAPEPPKEVKEVEKVGFMKKIKYSLVSPRRLFENTSEDSVGKSLGYYEVLQIFPFIGMILMALVLGSLISEFVGPFLIGTPLEDIASDFVLYSAIGGFVFSFVIMPLILLINGLFIHGFMRLYGGKGKFSDTMRVMAYASTPMLILSLAYPLSGIGGVWSFVVAIIGMSVVHKTSGWRAFFAFLSLALILMIVWLVIVVVGLSMGGGAPVLP